MAQDKIKRKFSRGVDQEERDERRRRKERDRQRKQKRRDKAKRDEPDE